MVWYLLFGLIIATAAVTGSHGRPGFIASILAFVYLTVFVGLRHHVGMDWNNYLRMIGKAAVATDLQDLLAVSEPAYSLILLGAHWSGFGIYAANILTTMIFVAGLVRLCGMAREPWLALMVAAPILIIAVGMSANRQAAAIGIICWAVADWEQSGIIKRTTIVIFAGLFHYSALIFLGFIALTVRLPPWLKAITLVLYVVLIYFILQQDDRFEYYDSSYLRGQSELTQSSGALFHVSLNAIPGALYLMLPSRRRTLFPSQLLRLIALSSLLMVPLAVVASAAAGRVSLYWYPMSILVLSSLPDTIRPQLRPTARLAIVSSMMGLLVGWLLLSNSSVAHLPYRNALFVDPAGLEIDP